MGEAWSRHPPHTSLNTLTPPPPTVPPSSSYIPQTFSNILTTLPVPPRLSSLLSFLQRPHTSPSDSTHLSSLTPLQPPHTSPNVRTFLQHSVSSNLHILPQTLPRLLQTPHTSLKNAFLTCEIVLNIALFVSNTSISNYIKRVKDCFLARLC